MKKSFFSYLLITILLSSCISQEVKETEEIQLQEESVELSRGYDSLLAKKYSADAYGMKTYVMAFLKSGPNKPADSAQSAKLMRAHLDNINRLAKEGRLIVAGPFYGNGDIRGIYLFDTDNLDSAKAFTESDPAIQFGSLQMELLKWYGTAALMGIPELHDKIAKEEV